MATDNHGTPPLTSQDASVRIEQAEGRILLYIDGVPRMLLSGNEGKLSAPGVNVITATDDQLVWSSAFKNLKIIDSDTITFNPTDFSPNGGYFSQVAQKYFEHGQTSTPVVLAFLEFPGGSGGPTHPLPYTVYDFVSGMPAYITEATADEFGVTFSIRSITVLGPQVPIRYYLLVETASAT